MNMFEHMEIMEYIYEVVVKPSYKKSTRADANRAGNSRNMRGESASSKTHYKTSKRSGKRKQRYVYHLRDRSKLTCIINGLGHSSDECKGLNDFGYKYTKIRHTKERRHEPAFKMFLENRKRTIIWSNMQLIILSFKRKKN